MNWHHDSPVPLLAASHAMSAPFGSPDVPLFSFPTVHRKKVVAAFDGGRITSDGGVMLLGAVERQLGIADTLARLISDPRNQALVTHGVDDILRARILAISCGYEDADDLDVLRTDPGFKVACGRLPDSGDDLCSQPTVSRWENAPTLREVVRMTYAMIDVYCCSYAHPPAAVTFDIDDTCDVAHGNQQLALFHAHYDERCFLPIHVYDAANARPVVVVFRPGKTPSGEEVRSHLRRMVRRIRGQRPALYLRLVRQRRARPNGGADCRRRAGAACRGAGAPGCDATRRTASRYGAAATRRSAGKRGAPPH